MSLLQSMLVVGEERQINVGWYISYETPCQTREMDLSAAIC